MIRGVIFDCFGVLAEEAWTPYRNKHFGTDGAEFDWANQQMHKVSIGELTADEFVQIICKKTGDNPVWLKDLLHQNPPNIELFDYISSDLKPRYKIGFLSNVGQNRLHELFTDEQIGLFDALVLSFEEGVAKPQPKVYRIIADRLQLPMVECAFVDDVARYCEGARMAGMAAIQYKNFEQFKNDLEGVCGRAT